MLRAFRLTLAIAVVVLPIYGLLIARIDGVDSWAVRWLFTGISAACFAATYRSSWVQRHMGFLFGSYLIGLACWLGVLAMINGLTPEIALVLTFTYFTLGIVFGIAFDTFRPLLIYIGVETAIAVGLVATTPVIGVDPATFLFGFSLTGLMLLAGTYNRLNDRDELQAQTQLLTSAERLGELGSWSHNLETGERRWSHGMYHLVGVPPATDEPPRVSEFAVPDSRKEMARQEHALMHGDIDLNDSRYRIVRADGEAREFRSITQLVRGDDGTPRRLVGAVVDITKQSEHESSLDAARREAETAMALKSALLTNMSYEIRTPLTAVIGFARLLGDELKGAHHDLVEPIASGGERLLASLDALLQFARLEAGEIDLKPRPIDVGAEVAALVPAFWREANEKGLTFDVVAPEASVYALAAPGEFGRVLGLLVSNAVTFTPSGSVTLGVLEVADDAVIIVRDTGPGVDPAILPTLFEPFQQGAKDAPARHVGPGLELAIAKRLVDAMGGTLEASSKPGAGTAFTIRLPRVSRPTPEAAPGTAWVSLASRLGASGESPKRWETTVEAS